MSLLPYRAQLSSFHTVNPDNNPFTVYVVTVQKGPAQWQVFRRFKEWEELRAQLCQSCGSAPPMPPKQLFGRMRPEVIESRVLGLNHFLQLLLSSPHYAGEPELAAFLERDQNTPPPGLHLSLDAAGDADASTADKTPEGLHKQQLKQLVESASQAFISLSVEATPLDQAFLAERANLYSAIIPAGTKLQLKPPPPLPIAADAAAAEAASRSLSLLLAAPPTAADDLLLVQKTVAGVTQAVASLAVQGKHEILVDVAA
uniref:PX domain-containing protein n=1 Tax=Haptolina ericina TaxID=156174 RepID=A0A7S3EXL5_9EUKA|mmetsp:Transcript_34052/g.77122  ORF Transcript_34052/g.77122 Transcript_34052/m.77122 type:complete len:258 (+) Transcript_34052:16-789(+)